MNILILGNGFDLAHKLPTTYANFLDFLRLIEESKPFSRLSESDITSAPLSPEVKRYIQNSLLTRDLYADESYATPPMIQELYTCLDHNIWYQYFQDKYQNNTIKGINWIDFENEIQVIIEFFDRFTDDVYTPTPLLSVNVPESISRFISIVTECQRLSNGGDCPFRLIDLINRSYHDLQRLVRCLEIYLCDCVNKIDINHVSPDIQALDIDAVLTFNYTNTLTRAYFSKGPIEFHHIHGRALPNSSPENNSIVLGVNEYWSGEDADTHTNWNLYKKFTQRIIKETGITYKKWLDDGAQIFQRIRDKYISLNQSENMTPPSGHIYIFGHSLDTSDKDILQEIIMAPGFDTTIFYKDKVQQSQQIANLCKVIGQNNLLEGANAVVPTIIFKKQAEMVPIDPKT